MDNEIAAIFREPATPAEDMERLALVADLEPLPDATEDLDERELRARLDRSLDRLLERAADLEAQVAANRAVYDSTMERAAHWLDVENGRVEKELAWLRGTLEGYWTHYPLRRRERSRSLPNGVVGWRASPGRWTITDPDAALDFALHEDLPIKQEVQVSSLKEWAAGETVDPETGEVRPREVPPFVDVEGAGDSFYYRPEF